MSGTLEQTAEMELDGDLETPVPTTRPERVSALVGGVALLTVFFVTQFLGLIPALAGFQIAKLSVLAVAIMFIASRERLTSRVRILSVPQVRYIIGILILAFATVPFAVWPSESLRFLLEVFLKNVIFVYFLVQAVRSDRDSRVIAGALIAGCCALVIAMLTGVGPLVTYKEEPRVSVGDSYDPNDMALLFVTAIPFAFFMLKSSRPLTRLFLLGSILLMLVGIVKGGSRGGFVGLLVIGAMIMLRGSRHARKYTLITVVVGAAIFAFVAPPSYWDRIGTIWNYEKDYNLKAEGGRLQIWRTGLGMIAARPLTGVGIAGFPTAHVQFSESKLEVSPHNTLVQITAELGVGGLILISLIILANFRTVRQVRRRAREDLRYAGMMWLASAVEVSFIGFLVSAFFLTHAYSAIFCFQVGIAAVLFVRYRSMAAAEVRQEGEVEYA
ncbi:MAG TPA: O-antigen ligase family protein [Blastocatellia bacterium]|nr:O-antigen ligase family protein [Blastocatellia bacterium]